MKKPLGISVVASYEELEEFEENYSELIENPDFTHFGNFDTLEEIIEELEYQGFTRESISEINKARYGNVMEVLEYNNQFHTFIGAR